MSLSKSILAWAVLFVALSASAVAAVLPASQVTGDALFNLSPPDRLSLNDFGSISLVDGRFGSVSFSALGTPSPSLVANAEIGPSTIATIFGRGAGFLTYFLEIVGPAGAVPVLIDVVGGATAFASSGASFAVESRWDLLDAGSSLAGDDIRSGQLSGSFSESFGRTVSLTLATSHVYSVFMLADAGAAATAQGSWATADAFVDPIFSFGPGVDPLAYAFNFSNGIANSSPVPEPDTLVVLMAGLLFLGLRHRHAIANRFHTAWGR